MGGEWVATYINIYQQNKTRQCRNATKATKCFSAMKNGLALKGFTSNHQKLMQFSSIFHEKGQQRLEKERRR